MYTEFSNDKYIGLSTDIKFLKYMEEYLDNG